MNGPPNNYSVEPPAPSREDERKATKRAMDEYEAEHGAVVTSPIIKHTVESLKATYPSLSKGNSPGPHKKDKK